MEDLLENNEFLSGYFQGNLDNDQKLEFERWLDDNQVSKSKLEGYRLLWESSKKLLNEESISVDRWSKLSTSLQFG